MDPVLCYCEKISVMKTSWTKNNPRRRFLGCPDYGRNSACGFFVRVDPPMCARSRDVILGLLKMITNHQAEIHGHRAIKRGLLACLVISWIFFVLVMLVAGVFGNGSGKDGNAGGDGDGAGIGNGTFLALI